MLSSTAFSPGVAQELAKHASRRQNGNSALLRHWTPIEKVKECGKLLSECLKAIPI
jgi:hypothetical protein